MKSYLDAVRILTEEAAAKRIPSEEMSLVKALNCVLAEDILSPEAVPNFDNSAMDGFAVESALTQGAGPERKVAFDVLGTVSAGESGEGFTQNGAVEIMTGAPMPAGRFDAVVKVEDVEVQRDDSGKPVRISLRAPVKWHENVRLKGEDFQVNQLAAKAGTEVTPELVMALASLGVSRVRARRKPRVAVISTGRELVDHESGTLRPGMIRNSTGPYLMAALPLLGAEGRFYGTIHDEPEHFIELFQRVCAEGVDVVLTTGAVSMGKHDFVREALEGLGARVVFHKVAIRPGKPVLFAQIPGGPAVFGLPGNPVSTSVGLRFFVEPYLRELRGLPAEKPIRARMLRTTGKPEGLRCFFKAELKVSEEAAEVEILTGQASFMVSPLLRSNVWAILEEPGRQVPEGAVVNVYPLFPMAREWGRLTHRPGHDKQDEGFHQEKGCCV